VSRSTLPYSNASSGVAAIGECERLLRKFGCGQFGTMNDWDRGVMVVQFQWKGRRVHLEASWRGYAEAWLKENPWSSKRRATREEWNQEAKRKGENAVPSILRDWIKGQVTAVEIGLMPFEHAFMPHMLANDGTRLIDHALKLLPPPECAP
jgi:hypothetical protein